jgi:hypothetical protein
MGLFLLHSLNCAMNKIYVLVNSITDDSDYPAGNTEVTFCAYKTREEADSHLEQLMLSYSAHRDYRIAEFKSNDPTGEEWNQLIDSVFRTFLDTQYLPREIQDYPMHPSDYSAWEHYVLNDPDQSVWSTLFGEFHKGKDGIVIENGCYGDSDFPHVQELPIWPKPHR